MQASNVPGLLCFLIQTIRSGEDPRLPKWQKLIKERDIRAAGGLGKTEFLALVAEELPCVNQCASRLSPVSRNTIDRHVNVKA